MTMVAGRALARSLGGAAAGPLGAAAGVALPMLLPRLAHRLGPWGMVGAAVGAWAVQQAFAKPAVLPLHQRPKIVTPPPVPMAMPYDGF
jgi:hypothetical protein